MLTCRQCGSDIPAGMQVCPTCGSTMHAEKAGNPQTPSAPRTARRWVVRGLVVTVVLVGVGVFLNQLLRTYHPVIEAQPTVAMATMYRDARISSTMTEATMDGDFITISLKVVQEKKLVRFFDPAKVQEIPLIAYVTPQGKLVTAMSKSEQCGSTDFYLTGNDIHCAVCPSYWNMASLEAYACCQRFYPDPLPSTVVGDRVRIEAEKVRTWKSRF